MKKNLLFTSLMAFGMAIAGFTAVDIHQNGEKIKAANAATAIATYYYNVNGTGSALLSSINQTIDDATDIGYDGLWNAYKTTDIRSDGKIYDLYSDNTSFTPGTKQCGNYSSIGDCYNREHTIPKSWWGSQQSGQGSDLYIVWPSDGKINSARSNYPFGECTNGTSYKLPDDPSGNKLGTSSNSDYVTGTVFEPFDSRKGDMARTMFYAMARYLTSCAGSQADAAHWTLDSGSKVFSPNGKNGFVQGYLNMLLKWHKNDPVSTMEINRNNLVENKQGNRNPFVDHPSWVDLIWGGTYGSNQTNGEDTSAGTVTHGQMSGDPSAYLTLDKTSANLSVGSTVSLTATLSSGSGTINWSTSNSSVATISSTTGATITVTGVAAGSATITCSSANAISATCPITVTSGGGGGGGGGQESGSYSLVYSDFPTTYPSSDTISKGGITYSIAKVATYDNATIQFQKDNGVLYNTTSIQYISSITIVVASGKSNNTTVYAGTTSGSGCTTAITPTNNVYTFTANTYSFFRIKNGSGASNFTSITIAYSSSSAQAKTLSSIAVSGQKTSFTQSDTFEFGGTVTATFSDASHDDVTSESIFTGYNMSNTGNQTVTVSYTYEGETKTTTYGITVNPAIVPEITAIANKTFKVGETITTSDITVYDENDSEITDYTFSNDGYLFTYEDAQSGGEITSKTFINSISYNNLTCNLTVQVYREEFTTSLGTIDDVLNVTSTGAKPNTYTTWTGVEGNSGTIYAGHSAGSNNSIQLRTDVTQSTYCSGIISTSSGGKVRNVSVTWESHTSNGRKIDIYGKNTAYSSPNDLFSDSTKGTLLGSIKYGTSTSLAITGDYLYIGIRSNSSALYLTDVTITYDDHQSPTNVANYIMYEDTNNQCESKYSIACGYFNDLSTSGRNTFMTSNDYVISTARDRLLAWARHNGQEIININNDYTFNNARMINITFINNSNDLFVVAIILAFAAISTLAFAYYARKQKSDR